MREQHFSFCFFFLKLTILLDIKEYQGISVAILGINNLLENQRLLHDLRQPIKYIGKHKSSRLWRTESFPTTDMAQLLGKPIQG